jgi:hypothetical protein
MDQGESPSRENESASVGDSFLKLLVDAANKTGMGIPVTLTVGGLLISGQLAARRDYFHAFAQTLRNVNFTPSDSAAAAAAASFLEEAFARPLETAAESPEEPTIIGDPEFLHLRDARVWHPSDDRSIPGSGSTGVWWRGQLTAVDGWTLGTLETVT